MLEYKTGFNKINIPASDGFPLSSLVFLPQKHIESVVIIGPALAVKKEFYINFSTFLSDRETLVVIPDYRGTGESIYGSLKHFNGSITDWGNKDLNGVIQWVIENFQGKKIHFIGHSMGSKVIGFAKNSLHLSSLIFVCSGGGPARNYPMNQRLTYLLLWRVLIPISTFIAGYFPGKKLGLKQNMPGGIMKDWANWCKQPNYIKDIVKNSCGMSFFSGIKSKIFALYFTDDKLTPLKTKKNVLDLYLKSEIKMKDINPKSLGLKSVGHFGLFNKNNGNTLWPVVLELLVNSNQSDDWPIYGKKP